ncbi:acyltransferase family protein [Azohydromonas australica]|uniref:acyltransferase family protein n=1 Tax=Azohydromonas australica TaxID=364039 RepID=UPI0003FC1560|nr:acyltransferase [Azohydromonas australica]
MTTKHFDYLDGWRGVAISFVLIGHFFPVPGFDFGPLGVVFFFVLSGLLMARLLFITETPLPTFYRRRISRILPAYLAFIALVTLATAAGGGEIKLDEVLASVFFLKNYVSGQEMPLGHIWSLSVEEHSYIILSLVALAARRKRVRPLFGVGLLTLLCAACAVAYALSVSNHAMRFKYGLHTEVAGLGIALSVFLHLALRGRRIPHATLAISVLIAIGIALYWWKTPAGIQILGGVTVLALAVNLLPSASAGLQRILSVRALRLLGLWSFSIYLWQQPFYLWASHGVMPKWVALLAALGCSLVSYYMLEKPARDYLNQVRFKPRYSVQG